MHLRCCPCHAPHPSPCCRWLSGQLVIYGALELPWGSGIRSLAGLQALRRTGGLALLHCDALADLSGLSGLASVAGSLVLEDNLRLASMQGLGPVR